MKQILVGVGIFFVSSSAFAQDHRFEIGAYGGYLFGGSAEGTSDTLQAKASIQSAPSYGAFVDVAVRRYAFAEISYTRQPTEMSLHLSDGQQFRYDLMVQYLQIGGQLEFRAPSADWLRPYFGGTIGATVFTANDQGFDYDEWRLSLMFQGGVKIQLAEFLGLWTRARLLATFLTDESALFCINGNCALAYSGTAVMQGEVGAGAYLAF